MKEVLRQMTEKPIKVDEQTDRLVSELAYFMRCSKKSIVGEAVREYAETRRRPAGTARRFEELPLSTRVALRRGELIRECTRLGASNLRVLDDPAGGADADVLELLVDSDVADGNEVIVALQDAANRLIGSPTQVESTTRLRLFSPMRLQQALDRSRAL